MSAAGSHSLRAAPGPDLARARGRALAVGIAGAVALGWGWWSDPAQFYHSYLMGFCFWIGISLGSLGILMLQHLTGGAWGIVIRRILEAAAWPIPLLALLFLPLLFGLKSLYPWADSVRVAGDELLRHKAVYLNPTGFVVRAAVCFVVWSGLAWLLARGSMEQERSTDPEIGSRLGRASGIGIALYVLTMTFAAVDWLMSLEPHWYSTLYGMFTVMGQALAALAFAILILAVLSEREPLRGRIGERHFHDLGKLLFAFVMLWSYFAFSQLLIIWSGNLPEEIPWYLKRLGGGRQYLAAALVALQFGVPFLLLLSARLKRDRRRLAAIAFFLLLMRLVDLAWIIGPSVHPDRIQPHWLDVVAPLGIGGIWLAAFLTALPSRPLLPLGDPGLEEALEHG